MINLPIPLEQLITIIQQLEPSDRAQIAKALIEVELQANLTHLIKELYSQPPIEDITDQDILEEIKAFRQQKDN